MLLRKERDGRLGPPRDLTPEQLLKKLIAAMCDHPEDVHFDMHVTQHSACFDVYLHDDDVSKVLGTGGSHAFALRAIFSAIYGRLGKKLYLMIIDPTYRR